MIGIINETVVSIKNRPDENSITVDEIFLGMIVTVLWEDVNEYCYVETSYNYKGYISRKKLTVKDSKVKKWMESPFYIVTGEYVDILDNISYDSKIITSVMRGGLLIGTDLSNKIRTRIMLPDGKIGWIRNEFINKKQEIETREKTEVREEIVNNSLKYFGKQFRWGGKSPFGVDSSGFSSMIYMISGLTIWRDSEFKEDNLVKIKKSEISRGDLIYGEEHTAIYLGNNKFINASAVSASVVIRSLDINDPEYDDIFTSEKTIYACHKLLRG